MKTKKNFSFRKCLLILMCLAVLGGCAALGLNAYVKHAAKGHILQAVDAPGDADCIIVLGCWVQDNGVPSEMLRDRIDTGISLYHDGAAPKLLMSGDHGRVQYNEVAAMKRRAIDAGVPSKDVFMDHAGFSTYETMYRARDVFGAKKVIIVTQEYHLFRAVYIAEKLGLEVYGVPADLHTYRGQTYRECREILARCKDFFTALFKPKPTFLGELIPISGSGDATNDKYWESEI